MTKEQFLSRKAPVKAIKLPDGVDAFIRKLSAADVEYVSKHFGTPDKALEGNRYVVLKGLADEQGVRLLEDTDAPKLASLEFDDVASIALEVLEFSGVRDRSAKKPSAG